MKVKFNFINLKNEFNSVINNFKRDNIDDSTTFTFKQADDVMIKGMPRSTGIVVAPQDPDPILDDVARTGIVVAPKDEPERLPDDIARTGIVVAPKDEPESLPDDIARTGIVVAPKDEPERLPDDITRTGIVVAPNQNDTVNNSNKDVFNISKIFKSFFNDKFKVFS